MTLHVDGPVWEWLLTWVCVGGAFGFVNGFTTALMDDWRAWRRRRAMRPRS